MNTDRHVNYPGVSVLGIILLAGFCMAGVAGAATFEAFETIQETIYRYGMGEAVDGFGQGLSDDDPTLAIERLAKAEPDECFYTVFAGEDNGTRWYDPDHTAAPEHPNIYAPGPGEDCTPNKVNQAYVWGLAQAGDSLWFGTTANVHCWIGSLYMGAGAGGNESWVCEDRYSQHLGSILDQWDLPIPEEFEDLIGGIGDVRPPRIYSYDTPAGVLTERGNDMGFLAQVDLQTTIGIRSAGSLDDVVLLGGPGLNPFAADTSQMLTVKLFAFNARTGAFIDSYSFGGLPGEPDTVVYNIRKWRVVDGVLYTTVGTITGGVFDGRVLRWNGDAADPFQFEVVGVIDTQGANLVAHAGRLFVSTWGGEGEFSSSDATAGVWMSPVIPEGGLTSAHAPMENWTKVWSADDYEPDPTIARTYGCGALASFDGYLYWGTMHVPHLSTYMLLEHLEDQLDQYYPLVTADVGAGPVVNPDDIPAVYDQFYRQINDAGHRAVALFRGRDFCDGDAQNGCNNLDKIDLLYGEAELPKFTLDLTAAPPYAVFRFDIVPNNMGAAPLFGPMGLGNVYNNYTWTMAVFQDRLWVGTMNSAYILWGNEDRRDYQTKFAQKKVRQVDDFGVTNPDTYDNGTEMTWRDDFEPVTSVGAHLYRFEDAASPAVPESTQGVGNYANYGIRTMVADDDALYLGMANPMNLLTDNTTDQSGPHFYRDDQNNRRFDYWEHNTGTHLGGWELIKLSDRMPGLNGRAAVIVGKPSVAGATVWDFTVMAPDDPGIDQTNRPAGMKFADGLFGFTIKDLPVTPDGEPGATVTVTLVLPDGYGDDARYYKITPNGFAEFVDGTTGEPLYVFAANTVTLTLTDGGPWDADGVKNGEIVDPGGPAAPPGAVGGGGSCFISTLVDSLRHRLRGRD